MPLVDALAKFLDSHPRIAKAVDIIHKIIVPLPLVWMLAIAYGVFLLAIIVVHVLRG